MSNWCLADFTMGASLGVAGNGFSTTAIVAVPGGSQIKAHSGQSRGGDFLLATSGDFDLATSEDFLMATDSLGAAWRRLLASPARTILSPDRGYNDQSD